MIPIIPRVKTELLLLTKILSRNPFEEKNTERGDNIQVALSTLAVINIYIYIYTRCTDKYLSDINNIPMITVPDL